MEKVAIILGNYKDYAQKYLPELLVSIKKQTYKGEMKIFIYDNATSEESFNFIQRSFAETRRGALETETRRGVSLQTVEIIRNKNNDGFAKGNNDAMELALAQGYEYIILFNLDMILDENCVAEMVGVAEETFLDPGSRIPVRDDNRKIGAVQARIMLWPEKEKINSIGNVTHFLGFGYSEGYKEKYTEETHPAPLLRGTPLNRGELTPPNLPLKQGEEYEICYPSGAAVLFTAEALKQVGLFDEEFWMYNEDQDLGWRLWLAGYRCVLAPAAVAYHKYEFSRSANKFYWLDRNRQLVIFKNYHWATQLLIIPAYLVMELGLLFYSINSGWWREKLKVYGYFLNPAHWAYGWRARSAAQKLRVVPDKDIIKMFSGKIWYQEIDDPKLRFVNPIFNAYWQVVKLIVWW